MRDTQFNAEKRFKNLTIPNFITYGSLLFALIGIYLLIKLTGPLNGVNKGDLSPPAERITIRVLSLQMTRWRALRQDIEELCVGKGLWQAKRLQECEKCR